jgi:hypothetical protein
MTRRRKTAATRGSAAESGHEASRRSPRGFKTKTRTASRPPRRAAKTSVPEARSSRFALQMEPGLARLVRESPVLGKAVRALTRSVTFTVAPRTRSGRRIQAQRGRLQDYEVADFVLDPGASAVAVRRMTKLGFEILTPDGRFGIQARGSATLISRTLGIRLALHVQSRRTPFRATQGFAASCDPPSPHELFIAPTESLTIKCKRWKEIDDFIFTPPPRYFDPLPTPPAHGYYGLNREKIRARLSVPDGFTGEGVTVAMVDSGFYRHPYYIANDCSLHPMPTAAAPDPTDDASGHGTAMAYNFFAVAPKARLLGYKQTDPAQFALEAAAASSAEVISCSWGWDGEETHPSVEAVIRSMVENGKIVLFGTGNGEMSWPVTMPQVIAVGGVYAPEVGEIEASNLASGFTSNIYQGRKVPDICGLCGQKPRGVYIMMPSQPGSRFDSLYAASAFPDGDETGGSDGWFSASGTSAATAQIAGVVALMIQEARRLDKKVTPEDVRRLLQVTARPVTIGKNANGVPADGHPNGAVGHGLVNAAAAIGALTG